MPGSAPCPRRVVYLGHSAALSGGEIALLRLLPALPEVDRHVILGEDGPLVDALRDAGVRAEVLPMVATARGLRRERVRAGSLPVRVPLAVAAYATHVAQRLRELRPDLVHTNSLKAAVYGGIAARLAGVPAVWHVRDRISPDYLPRQAVLTVHALGRVLPSAFVFNSRATASTMPWWALAGQPRLVMHDPVPEALSQQSRPLAAGVRAADDLVVGMLGRISPWKGQDLFVRAFGRAFPTGGVRAVIAGAAMFGEQAYEQQLRQLIADLGLQSRVTLLGFCPDVAAVFGQIDVLVHASLIPEPFGQVVAEGMAAGLPVVAPSSGGPAEIIRADRTGMFYPMGDEEELARALRRLADDPTLRRRLGADAREQAAEFRPSRAAGPLMSLYAEVLDRPRIGHRLASSA